MRSLAEPAIDDVKLYDAITAAKQQPRRARLELARDVVLQAYDDYQAVRPHLQTIVAPNLGDEAREALHHCYSSDTAPFSDARSTLMASLRAVRCPFCGVSEASTLDHYLPKKLHPVYSVYSRNLVPCCPHCNARKSEKIVDHQTGVRRFLHPYYDVVPTESFLRVSVQMKPNLIVIGFRVERPQGLTVRVYRQLKSHFEELGLASRYRVNALVELSEDRRAFARWFGGDGSGAKLAEELALKADDRELEYGANDWLCVLYRKLAHTPAFTSGGFRVLDAIQ